MIPLFRRSTQRFVSRASVAPRRFSAQAATAAPRAMRADALLPNLLAAGAGAAALALVLRGDKSPVGLDSRDSLKERIDSLEIRAAALEIQAAERTSAAFVFIKPHAVTEDVKALVRKELAANGIVVKSEGSIAAETIDKERLIDVHYGAIAAKAVKQQPSTLTVQPKAQAQFEKTFGISWSDALSKGLVYNATDGAAKLGFTFDQLGKAWGTLKKDVTLLKFGGGFYCGKVDGIFVINGFYMDMRKAFTTPGTSIYYFETEWPSQALPWADFRGKVLGGTDPKTAEAGSLRNNIYKNWQSLKLKSVPNTGDNGVHASASPLEALAERCNWLGAPLAGDAFGRAMLASGVPLKMLKAWTDDPPVSFEGKKQSLFDLLEDLDVSECLEKSAKIAKEN